LTSGVIDSEYYVFEVMDNGIGMNSENKERLGRGIQNILDLYNAKVMFKEGKYSTHIAVKICRMEHML
jgi:hypothetical protein